MLCFNKDKFAAQFLPEKSAGLISISSLARKKFTGALGIDLLCQSFERMDVCSGTEIDIAVFSFAGDGPICQL